MSLDGTIRSFGDNGGSAWGQLELDAMADDELAYAAWQKKWAKTRRANQMPPPGDWHVWNILAGRGYGKTRTGAETLLRWALTEPGTRWLVAAPTSGDLRNVCFEGESGLISILPPQLIADYNKSLSKLEVRCPYGGTSLILGIPAEKPERFRGPQFMGGWLDEVGAWTYAQAAWDMIMFGMRLGEHPRMIVTTTPRPKPLIVQMAQNSIPGLKVHTTRGSSIDNFKNLAPTFRDQLMAYEGTQLGRQEIYGEIIDPEESGIIKRSMFNLWPAAMPLPAFDEIVMSLDTAFTEENRDKKTGDPDFTACIVAGVWTSKPIGAKGPGQTNAMILDVWEERLSFPELLHRLIEIELKSRYGGEEQKPVFRPQLGPATLEGSGRFVDTLVIENKGSGISLRQMMEKEGVFAYPYNPGKADKVARLHGISHIVNAGVIYLWESEERPGRPRDWVEPMLAQVCAFTGKGSTRHDDLTDSFSQLVRYIADRWRITVVRKKTPLEETADTAPVKPSNPYAT